MSLIKSALVSASLTVAGLLSAPAAQAYDSSRIESMRTYEWWPKAQMSAEARRARAQTFTTTTRQVAPFSRMALETYIQ